MAEMDVKSLLGFGVLFLIIAIAIGLGANILTEVQTTQTDNSATIANNFTLTWGGNNTAMALNHPRIVESSLVLYNNGTKINKGTNYTTSLSTITIINVSSPKPQTEWVVDALNVTYAYYYGSAAYNTTTHGLATQVTFAKWLPTIALVIVIAVILGVIMLYLMNRYQ